MSMMNMIRNGVFTRRIPKSFRCFSNFSAHQPGGLDSALETKSSGSANGSLGGVPSGLLPASSSW